VTLVRILHDHDDDQIRILLSAIRKALPEFGRLIIAEPMAATPGAQAMGDAYFGLYLWAMASGRPRSFAEIRCFLNEAGFAHVRERRSRQPLLTRVIEAL
jgi:demethylspheroidene O-methyltransferase